MQRFGMFASLTITGLPPPKASPMRVSFTVPGPPIPKARPRFGKGGRVYTPKKTLAHQAKWARAFEEVRPIDWPLAAEYVVNAHFVMGTRAPSDLDNHQKCIDGLNGVAFYDDSMIAEWHVTRSYDPDNPRTEIDIEVLRELDTKEAGRWLRAKPKKSGRRPRPKEAHGVHGHRGQ